MDYKLINSSDDISNVQQIEISGDRSIKRVMVSRVLHMTGHETVSIGEALVAVLKAVEQARDEDLTLADCPRCGGRWNGSECLEQCGYCESW